jgi:hypothetical protein
MYQALRHLPVMTESLVLSLRVHFPTITPHLITEVAVFSPLVRPFCVSLNVVYARIGKIEIRDIP